VEFADDLQTWLAENQSRKVLHWVERHPNLSESFDGLDLNGTRLDPFFNANTPEDIDLANTLAGAMAEKDNTA
jgi:molybdopterin-guanine dinucleotide biosynthesis protein A